MNKLYEYDNNLRKKKKISLIAGFDEAGRGPIAGPVFASGVILKPEFNHELINDSKKLSAKKRELLYDYITYNSIAYEIVQIDVKTIDKINILEASRKAMEICLSKLLLKSNIELILTDYMKLHTDILLISLIKGDATSLNVASSSILAKVARDRYMQELDKKYPEYDFKNNKGYLTKKHLEAIKKFGYIKGVHRTSFEPIKTIIEYDNQIQLEF